MNLHSDIYTTIYNSTDNITSAKLSVVNKVANEAYLKRQDKYTYAGNYKLKPCQKYIVKLISEGYNVELKAPMSWGKTAVGIASSLFHYQEVRTQRLWVIVVPSKAIHTWKDEVIKMYGSGAFNPKNLNSPIIIPHSSISTTHNNITKLSDVSALTHVVVISGSKNRFLYDTDFNLIVDEAHTCEKWKKLYYDAKNKQTLLLSASSHNNYIPATPKNKRITIVWDQTSGVIPNAVHNYYAVDKREMRPVGMKERTLDAFVYIQAVDILMKQIKNARTVIFLPGGVFYNPLVSEITNICKLYGHKVYEYNNTGTIRSFEKYLDSVLLITHAASESINIDCEICITIRIDWVNTDRIIQTIGRCLRTTNPNKELHVYHILPDGYPKYKAMYASSCGKLGVSPITELEPGGLINAFKMIHLLNTTLDADIVAICDYNNNITLDWWKKQKSSVPDKTKETLLSF
jgi:hypothetical protein